METKSKNNIIDWSIFWIFAISTIIIVNNIHPNFTPFILVLFGALYGMICMILAIMIRKFINYIQNARKGHIQGEANILYIKPISNSKFNPNKSFLTKLAWRYLFTKVKNDNLINKGCCINCAANGDTNVEFDCYQYYCPCNWNEQLKRKTKYV